MALTHRASRPELAPVEPGILAERERRPHPPEEGSVTDLATRLAQEGWDLVAAELRRISAEVRQRRQHAGRVVLALLLTSTFMVLAALALSVALFLHLGRTWGNYAAGALVTGVVLLVSAAVAGGLLKASARRLGGGKPASETTAERQERSLEHGP